MNERALKTLEYYKIIDRLKNHAASSMGKRLCESLVPSSDYDEIKRWQKETSEASSMVLKKGSLSLGGLRDIKPYLERTEVGGILSIEELIDIADFLYACDKAQRYGKSESKNDNWPLLQPQFEAIKTAKGLENEINRCIDSDKQISDNASRNLRDIRRNIKVSNDRIKEALNTIIHSQNYKNMLQESVITIRNDRYCVPVKAEYKNSFTGMIHDQSSTGATVFIEPISVVQLNNKIKDLKASEKDEIEKILWQLSVSVNENRAELAVNLEILSNLDFIFAKAELSISMKATEPVLNNRGYIDIKKARHPLLDEDKVVPINVYLGKDFKTLLITGPNTGGKTVSLKTIGLLTLMGQAGLHIPAFDNSQLAVFEEVFADIGDEQSIEQSLSTFSAHMTNIVRIFDNVTNSSLVLMDELGAGTDPTEGAALAISIIKYLHALNVRTVVTTHYSELKVFALSTDGVENASCEFDVETLRPTYKLLIGVPGKSNAFAISRRLGLPEHIIETAKDSLNNTDVRFEDVITDLEISKKALVVEQEKAEQYKLEAERLKKDVEKQKQKLAEQKERILREANEKARRIISDAKDDADSIIKDLNKLKRENAQAKELEEKRAYLRSKLATADDNLAKLSKETKPFKSLKADKIRIGDKVHIHSLDQNGIVMSLPDASGNVLIKAGIMKVKINVSDLSVDKSEDLFNTKSKSNVVVGFKNKKSSSVSAELDLRGLMVSEGIDRLDKYLDDAYLAGLSPVTVIHGKGTGALRSAVHNHLKGHRHVKGFRLGQYGEGESGVTIIELK